MAQLSDGSWCLDYLAEEVLEGEHRGKNAGVADRPGPVEYAGLEYLLCRSRKPKYEGLERVLCRNRKLTVKG
jgi:hypothetical protein